MRLFRVAVVVMVLVSASTAWALKVSVEHEPDVDFSQYSTYSIRPRTAASEPKYQARIEARIDETLSAVGWKKVDADPDVEVVTLAYSEQEIKGSVNNMMAATKGWSQPALDAQQITNGTLLIHMVDTRTGDHVWRAGATKTLSERTTPEKVLKVIDGALRRMFKGFPPD